MTWIAPDVERSEHYPQRRNEPEREMLRDWLDWHRATLLRKCAGLDGALLARRAVPPSNLSLLGKDVLESLMTCKRRLTRNRRHIGRNIMRHNLRINLAKLPVDKILGKNEF